MKNKTIPTSIVSILFFAISFLANAQETTDFPTKVQSQFLSFMDNFRQEKLYLQTDKPYYSAGETIWMKGYLVNAATLRPESLSGFIYVELINRNDSVLSRVKIQRDATGFSGHIELDQATPAGEYNLRAYTQWMQNNASDFFFSKNIHIGNKIEDAVNLSTTYGNLVDGQVLVTINFTDEHKLPFVEKEIEVSGWWSESGKMRDKTLSLTTSSDGTISFDLPIDTLTHSPSVLDISIMVGSTSFDTQLFLPDFRTDFDLQFFPESGVLLDKGLQNVAFKAIGADGLSIDVSGSIYSKNGEELSTIKTTFNGMGKLLLNTAPGESYYVIVKTSDGVEKRFDLPELVEEGVSLRLDHYRGNINYRVTNHLSDQSEPLYLLIHSNGKPFVVSPINNSMGQVSKLALQDEGVFSFSVIDTLGNVYCERLFFRNSEATPQISMSSDQETYSKRELINLNFNVQPTLDNTPEGFYSLSVTDSKYVLPDTINDNIISHLLLSSDLKGHIENPISYFTDEGMSSQAKLDLLMLTQGWRRYNTSHLLKDKLEHGEYDMEAGQTISGRVVNYFGKKVKDADVFGLVDDVIILAKSDDNGEFVFDGMGFQDSVSFVLRAEKRGNITGVKIIPDQEVFPSPEFKAVNRGKREQKIAEDYFDQSRLKFFSEGGVRHIYLDEVTIEGSKKKRKTSSNIFSSASGSGLSSEDLERYAGRDLLTVLGTIPGVMVSNRRISVRGNEGPPRILIDGIARGDVDFLETITVDNVESIEVYKDALASFFGGGAGGVIDIKTKRGITHYEEQPLSVANISPLGFQKPVEFYVPKYDVQSVKNNVNPDLRTTIYWNPRLQTDSLGNVDVSFYTADPANDYRVVLEGVTKDGELCRYEGLIKRNE